MSGARRWSAGGVAVASCLLALIMKEPDLGTALVCLAVTAMMLYLAGAKIRYFA